MFAGKTVKKNKKKNRARKDDAEPTADAEKDSPKVAHEQTTTVKSEKKVRTSISLNN